MCGTADAKTPESQLRPSASVGLGSGRKGQVGTPCGRVAAVCTGGCFIFSHHTPHTHSSDHSTPAAALGRSPPVVSARRGPEPPLLQGAPSFHGVPGFP